MLINRIENPKAARQLTSGGGTRFLRIAEARSLSQPRPHVGNVFLPHALALETTFRGHCRVSRLFASMTLASFRQMPTYDVPSL
jgi:hypothetical protein